MSRVSNLARVSWTGWRLKANGVHCGKPYLLELLRYQIADRIINVTRYALQLLTPASILAALAGRSEIEVDDIAEMNELFLDAKTSAGLIAAGGGFDGGKMW
jgi:hypothetical protein